MQHTLIPRLMLLCLVALAVLPPLAARATTFVFTGAAGNSDWFNTSNWSPNGSPGTSDTASITSKTVNLSHSSGVGGLILAGSSRLTGSALTVNSSFAWSGGAVANTVNVVAAAQQTISGSADKSVTGVLNNAGTATWTGTGKIIVAPETTAAALNNTGTIVDQGDHVLDNSSPTTAPAVFNNQGTFTKSGGTGVTAFGNLRFNNSGSLNVNSGSLNLNGVVTNSSTFNAGPGAQINLVSGSYTLNGGATFAGAGTTRVTNINGTSVALNGTAAVTGTFEIASTLVASTAVQFNGSGQVKWTDGSVGGTVGIASGTQFNISGATNKMLAGTVNNAGLATWNGPGGIVSAGTFNNSGAFAAQSDGNFAGGNGTFNNTGTFAKAGGTGTTNIGDTQNAVTFNNSGAVNVSTGTLQIMGAPGVSAGSFTVAPTAALNFLAGHTFGGTIAAAPAGVVNFGGGGAGPSYVFNNGSTLAAGGLYRVVDVVKLNGAPAVNGTFELNAGAVNGGAVTLGGSGQVAWTGSAISNGASVSIAPSTQFNIAGTAVKTLSGAVINNAGLATWTGEGPIAIDAAAAINNTGQFTAQGDGSLTPASGAAAAAFNNLAGATFTKATGTGSTTVGAGGAGVAFNNSGQVTVLSGALALNGGGTQSGTFTTSKGGLVQFAAGNYTFNAGTKCTGDGASEVTGAVNLNGNVDINNGFVLAPGCNVLPSSSVGFAGTGVFYWAGGEIDGSISVDPATGLNLAGNVDHIIGGTLNATGHSVANSVGSLDGTGTVAGDVVNTAAVAPGGITAQPQAVAQRNDGRLVGDGGGIGTLTISGNFTQQLTGSLNVQLGGALTGQSDQLKVVRTAVLGGTLNISHLPNFRPNIGDTFQVMQFASHQGQFDKVQGVDTGNNLLLQPEVRANGVFLRVVAKWPSLAGRVTTSGGAAVAGVSVVRRFAGATAIQDTVTTTGTGAYTFLNVPPGRFALTSTKSGLSFHPPVQVVTMGSSALTGVDFTALESPSITGRVVDGAAVPVAGVVVTRRLASATTGGVSATTNAGGFYSFSRVAAGSYNLIPNKAGYVFTPVSRVATITNGASAANNDFVARVVTFPIAGVLTKGAAPLTSTGTLVPNVPVFVFQRTRPQALPAVLITPALLAANPSVITRATTNAAGQYAARAAVGGYYVIPGRPGVFWTPAYRAVNVTTAPVTGQNFAGAGLDSTAPVVTIATGAGVTGSAHAGASGVLTVVATLQDAAGRYLDWTATAPTPSFSAQPNIGSYRLATAPGGTSPLFNLAAVANQTWSLSLPATLPAGTYRVTMRAVSRALLISAPLVRTVVKTSGAARATSGVSLSSATASANASTVTLGFFGSLDAEWAADAAHYVIIIGARAVAVESASYNAVAHTVTLQLPEGAMAVGTKVAVQWSEWSNSGGGDWAGATTTMAR